jgi:hypothetical protein
LASPSAIVCKWVLKLGDQELASGTSKFDPTKSPKHIDLTHESGPLKGETLLGIYKLFGDKYTADKFLGKFLGEFLGGQAMNS